MEMLTPEGEVLARVESGQSGSGWHSDYLAYQPEYEAAIDARARELGARVLMSATAVSLTQAGERAETVVRSSDDGSVESTIESRYVIGADGAHSFVRTAIGAERRDLGFSSEPHLVIDFEFSDPDCEIPELPEAAQVLDPWRPQLTGRWGGRRHTRWEFAARPGESREQLESEENCWDLIKSSGVTPEHGTIVRRAVYDFESSITEPWRVDRVLLMGDAAHTMPPHMGQGMQSGIRDAENLAWKLAAVIAADADPVLLDTYQSERKPHVMALIGMSSGLGEMVAMTDPEAVAVRNEVLRSGSMPPTVFPRLGDGLTLGAGDVGTLDTPGGDGRPSLQARVAKGTQTDRLDNFLPFAGWTIVSRHAVPRELFDERQWALLRSLSMQFAHVSRGAAGDSAFWDIDAEYDRWYRGSGRRAFIERPDHYVFGTAEQIDDLPALVDILAAKLAAAGWHAAYVPELSL